MRKLIVFALILSAIRYLYISTAGLKEAAPMMLMRYEWSNEAYYAGLTFGLLLLGSAIGYLVNNPFFKHLTIALLIVEAIYLFVTAIVLFLNGEPVMGFSLLTNGVINILVIGFMRYAEKK